MVNVQNILLECGLTKNETKVYLALLDIGISTSGPIIKKTGIHTSKVYDALDRLMEKGLVTYVVKENIKYFSAVDPARLQDFLEDKKNKIQEQMQEIKKIIPQLKLRKKAEDQTQAEIFSGWKGLETVYKMLRESMKRGETNYVFGASKGEDEERVRLFFNRHVTLLSQKGIKQKIIYNESARGNIAEQYKHPKLFQIKYLLNTTPAEINIWHNHVMIVVLRKTPIVVLISDKKVADSFLDYFNVMWSIAK